MRKTHFIYRYSNTCKYHPRTDPVQSMHLAQLNSKQTTCQVQYKVTKCSLTHTQQSEIREIHSTHSPSSSMATRYNHYHIINQQYSDLKHSARLGLCNAQPKLCNKDWQHIFLISLTLPRNHSSSTSSNHCAVIFLNLTTLAVALKCHETTIHRYPNTSFTGSCFSCTQKEIYKES